MRAAIITALAVLALGLCGTSVRAAPEESLVAGCYEKYLGRSAFADELPYWTNQMRQGATTDDIRAGILGSDEFYSRRGQTPEGFVAGLYAHILGRIPLDRETRYWVDRLQSRGCRPALAREFIGDANRDLAQASVPAAAPAIGPEPEQLRRPLRVEGQ